VLGKRGHSLQQLIGGKPHQVNLLQLSGVATQFFASRLEPVSFKLRYPGNYGNIAGAGVKAQRQIQRAPNIHRKCHPGYVGPKFVTLDSGGGDGSEYDGDTGKHLVAKLRRETQGRIGDHNYEVRLLPGVLVTQDLAQAVLIFAAAELLRFQIFHMKINRRRNPRPDGRLQRLGIKNLTLGEAEKNEYVFRLSGIGAKGDGPKGDQEEHAQDRTPHLMGTVRAGISPLKSLPFHVRFPIRDLRLSNWGHLGSPHRAYLSRRKTSVETHNLCCQLVVIVTTGIG
jgi:hypothetical protein